MELKTFLDLLLDQAKTANFTDEDVLGECIIAYLVRRC